MNKIKIGDKEHQKPVRYKACISAIVDYLNDPLFYLSSMTAESDGHSIAEALNNYTDVLQERREIIDMLTDGSYCRQVEHMQGICLCEEIRKDIEGRPVSGGWRVIERDGLPKDGKDYLWQYAPNHSRAGSQTVGRYSLRTGQIMSQGFTINPAWFVAYCPLPQPYEQV